MSNTRAAAIFLMQAAALTTISQAATIFDSGLIAVTAGDPTQLGRLTRNAIPSDWSTPKPFPGVTSPTSTFRYHVFNVPIPTLAPYIQISIDDISGTAASFASAYYGSYNPNPLAVNRGLDTNYLGDAGSSGNPFGNPRPFQIIMPGSGNLIVVVNDTGVGLNQAFDILVEAFADTSFTDPAVTITPEPASLWLSATSLLVFGLLILLQKRKSGPARI